jgi:hypothetical protein
MAFTIAANCPSNAKLTGRANKPMMDDPILRIVFELFGIVVAAFAVGTLLFQFRFRAIWCFIAGEGAVLLLGYFGTDTTIRSMHRAAYDWLSFMHLLGLPMLFAPLFAGYYFNKCVIIHENNGAAN